MANQAEDEEFQDNSTSDVKEENKDKAPNLTATYLAACVSSKRSAKERV